VKVVRSPEGDFFAYAIAIDVETAILLVSGLQIVMSEVEADTDIGLMIDMPVGRLQFP
jgi:hypothetical protein